MTETTKKCPMCAELVPADALFCPYCATRFGEQAPIATTPASTPVVAPATPAIQQPPAVAMPRKASFTGWWVAGGAVLLILVGIIAILLWTQRQSLPLVVNLLPSATSTPLPPTQTPQDTPTHTLVPSPTATSIPAWVTGIADPILQAVSGATPDYQQDFLVYTTWDFDGGNVVILDGVLKITAFEPGAGEVWNTPGLNTQDFVALVSIDLSGLNGEDTAAVGWAGHYEIAFRHDGRWYINHNNLQDGIDQILEAGQVQIDDIQHIMVKLISYVDHFYLYINDLPQASVAYGIDRPYGGPLKGTGIGLSGKSGESTTAIARFDLIYVWNLNHFQNLP
jgi:hypothetical protein